METPVPIPNTMVKHMSADDTWLETTWESRWLPDFKKQKNSRGNDRVLHKNMLDFEKEKSFLGA